MSVHRLLKKFKGEIVDRMEFTIFFEKPYWIGICVRYTENCIFSSRYVFGSEPSNSEILDFYLNYFDRMKFVECSVSSVEPAVKKISYKKSQHKCKKEMPPEEGRPVIYIIQACRSIC